MPNIYTDGTYGEQNPTWHAEDSPWKATQFIRMLDSRGLEPSLVAEIGCGAGGILVKLRERYPTARLEGWDISAQAIEVARDQEEDGLTFRHGDLLTAEVDPFDLLIVADVIEHVEDPFGFCRAIRPLAHWKLLHIPLDMNVQLIARGTPLISLRKKVGHLHYFSRDTAIFLLEECGHEIVDWTYTTPQIDQGVVKGRLARAIRPLRRIGVRISPDATARVLGGMSLLVLTT